MEEEKVNFIPARDKLLIRPYANKTTLIITPDGTNPTQGTVVAAGTDTRGYDVGDLVLFRPKAGAWIGVDGVKYLIMGDFEPFGKFTKEQDDEIPTFTEDLTEAIKNQPN